MMYNWIHNSLSLPESAPEEIKKACIKWKTGYPSQVEIHSTSTLRMEDAEPMTGIISIPSEEATEPQKLISNILEIIFSKNTPINTNTITPLTPKESSQAQFPKQTPSTDISLAAAMMRLYPPKSIYNIKTAHTTDGSQWQPTNPPTTRFIPPLPSTITIRTPLSTLVPTAVAIPPHESVLDYLTDVMRSKPLPSPTVPSQN